MPQWTHKATWPDGPGHTIIDDRCVYRDGVRVGRVYVERFGPQRGIYQWFGQALTAGGVAWSAAFLLFFNAYAPILLKTHER